MEAGYKKALKYMAVNSSRVSKNFNQIFFQRTSTIQSLSEFYITLLRQWPDYYGRGVYSYKNCGASRWN